MDITFSIVTPVYNGERYLRRCIDSILAQRHGAFEALFVDDGSTDGSGDIIRAYADPRIRLVSQENAGVSAARNHGIRESRYTHVAFLDADDCWYPDHLETLAGLINAYPDAGVYSTGFRMIYENNTVPAVVFAETGGAEHAELQNPFGVWRSGAVVTNCSNTAVPRALLMDAGMFREGELENEDMDLWVRIGLRRSLAVSSKITSTYYQTSTAGKPRFRRFPGHILSCVTVLRVLEEEADLSPERRQALERFVRAWNRIYFWRFVRVNARKTLKKILENSGARHHAPVCFWALQFGVLWPLVRAAGIIRSPFVSRKFLGLLGGARRQYGVVLRLEPNGER